MALPSRMLPVLVLLLLLLTAADHWTTYLCLRQPVPGWQVSEANPLAGWLFERLGLVEGILLDSLVTLAAAGYLLATPRVPRVAKGLFLATVSAWSGWAVANNLDALATLGLSPWGNA